MHYEKHFTLEEAQALELSELRERFAQEQLEAKRLANQELTETAHHFWYRSNYGHLILDLDNGIGIGRSCHFTIHHKDPKKISEQIRAKRGEEWYQRLKHKAFNRPKSGYKTLFWLEEQIKKL